MSSGIYADGRRLYMLDGDMVGSEGNLYLMLIGGSGAPTFTDAAGIKVSTVLTHGTNADAVTDGYTALGVRLSVGGPGGSGEGAHTLSTSTATGPVVHLEDDKTGVTWTAVGGSTPDTIYGALLYYAIVGGTPVAANDIPLILFDPADSKTTNGGDFSFNWGIEDTNNVVCKYTSV